jgi:hypothetical protein
VSRYGVAEGDPRAELVLEALVAEQGCARIEHVGAALRSAGQRVGQTMELVQELVAQGFTVEYCEGLTYVRL